MSIIRKKYDDGDTQLNKLKFAPYMGPSNPPLVERRIPNEVNPEPPRSGEIQTRADDASRILKIFTRREGLQHLTNNTTLNTAIAQSYTIKGTVLDKAKALLDVNRGEALLNTTRMLGTTLAQVPLAGTGVHFIRGKLFGQPSSYASKPSTAMIKTGDPGSVKVKYGRDSMTGRSPSPYGKDIVNSVGPYTPSTLPSGPDYPLDYIKFYFEVLKPGESENTFIHLRAFLDSFDDNYTGAWDSFNYVGRGEKFYTYQGFERSISVSFKTAVATKVELKPVYQKLVYLASTTAPTYSPTDPETGKGGGIMRGTIVRLNIGDYISDTPGFINNVSFGWESAYPFEIALGNKEGKSNVDQSANSDDIVQELPHILNCSFTFTPIHTFTPQTGLYHYITNPTVNQFFPTVKETEERSAALKSQLSKEPPAFQPTTNTNYNGIV